MDICYFLGSIVGTLRNYKNGHNVHPKWPLETVAQRGAREVPPEGFSGLGLRVAIYFKYAPMSPLP